MKWSMVALIVLMSFLGITDTPALASDARLAELLLEAGLTPYRTPEGIGDFTYPDVRTGEPVSFKQAFGGKVVMLNTWATWCPPCIREMPSFQALYDRFQARGLVVLGLGYAERGGGGAQKAFAQARRFTYPMVIGRKYNEVPDFYRGFWIPQTYVIDRQGRVVGHRRFDLDWTSTGVVALVEHLLEAPAAR